MHCNIPFSISSSAEQSRSVFLHVHFQFAFEFLTSPVIRSLIQIHNSDKTESLLGYMSALEVGAMDDSWDYLGVSFSNP